MNNYIKIGLLLCFPILLQAQLQLNNNGVVLKVRTGTTLRVNNGAIKNQNSAAIDNNGNIYLDGTFDQNSAAIYTGGATSWLWFEGAVDQNITSDDALNIARLRVDNGNRLVLGNQVNVSTDVDLMNNGNIELGVHNLVLASGATIVNYDASNYIITNNTGILQQEVAAANVFFPVGNSSYNPATLSNSGVTDNLQVRVFDQVFDQGTTGTVQTANVVDRTWMVSEETTGGSVVTMTLQWSTADELAFDRTNSGVAHHLTGSTWDYPAPYTAATAAGADWTHTRSGFTSFSPFIVLDASIDLPVELLHFNANRSDINSVNLTWATASETNNKGFEVERMLSNETEFSKVAWVDGHGTTTSVNHYELNDPNSFADISYYRLKQLDFDGTFSYSAIKAVEGHGLSQDINLFPNPADSYINIQLSDDVKAANFEIFDSKGSLVIQRKVSVKANELVRLDGLDDLASGMYLLSIRTENGQTYTRKFEKIRH